MRGPLLILLFLILASFPVRSIAQQSGNHIVLVAGMKSHGPEGNGIHDYAWSARLLKTMLENSNIRDSVKVSMHLNGWPHDESLLRDADAIMVISDGRDGDTGREAPHLATARRIQMMEERVADGCGVVTFHFATFAPDALADKAIQWYGGYFDWETDGRRDWYSEITTVTAEVKPASAHHPILNGVRPFSIREEFYFDIRFQENDTGWSPIWSVDTLPATKPRGNVVAWAVQRENGSRGFATTCGHYYANWENAHFRKSILNGLAWAAHVPVPTDGVTSRYFSRDEIARHLGEPNLFETRSGGLSDRDKDAYADQPYWYQPGHPIKPAEPGAIETLPGFVAEKAFTVPAAWGSWTAVTVDGQGRLICAAQHKPGLYRSQRFSRSDSPASLEFEALQGPAAEMGWSHGLLAAFDSLYVTVAEGNDAVAGGVYRLRDTNGDDQYDESSRILSLNLSGEHGPHNIVVGPEGESLWMICGNGTNVPKNVARRCPTKTAGIDHLMPPGFESSRYTPAGFVIRFQPGGGDRRLICTGMRNSFDLAFNHHGDLFTFDSDMEWDLGAPWYRPTRICHLVTGGEFGWRADAAKWPEYFPDSMAPVINVGPGSPTGIAFGYGADFPVKYQHALFVCDWTFATIHAVHLEPKGASYSASIEQFLGGSGLPVTDLVIGADGAMYFLVGGRRLGSALYRVRYTGAQTTRRSAAPEMAPPIAKLHNARRRLEGFHGRRDAKAVLAAWPYLGHRDRVLRFAARVAIESQPANQWRNRAMRENNVMRKIHGLLALARQDESSNLAEVVEHLIAIDDSRLPAEEILAMLRAIEICLARGNDQVTARHDALVTKVRSLLPHHDWRVNRELARLACFLRDHSMIEMLLEWMSADRGRRPVLGSGYFVRNEKYGQAVRDILQSAPLVDRMHFAQMLLWFDDGWTLEQREDYFRLIADAASHTKGGYWYVEFWNRIREVAMDQVPEAHREHLAELTPLPIRLLDEHDLPKPEGPGETWELDELLSAVETQFHGRDFENGKKMFSAATCVICHRFNGEGSSVGPDLSSIGQRFTLRDILDSTLHPSKAVSDQYRVSIVLTADGQTVSGRIVSRDSNRLAIATDLRRPSQTTDMLLEQIENEKRTPISTMPEDLLNPLNIDEVLDLLAYLVSGGNEEHPVFRP